MGKSLPGFKTPVPIALHSKRDAFPSKGITLGDFLCDLWSKNEFGTLWNLAKGRAIPVAHESHENEKRQIESAVSMARAGLFGKASRLLLCSGLAPNTDITWQLLLPKHPSCPPPVAPLMPSTPATIGPDFNMFAILHSFPKDTAEVLQALGSKTG